MLCIELCAEAVNHLSNNIAYYFLGADILACFTRRMRAASSLAAQVGRPGYFQILHACYRHRHA